MALKPSLYLSLVKVSVYTSLASMSAIISDVGQYFSFATIVIQKANGNNAYIHISWIYAILPSLIGKNIF